MHNTRTLKQNQLNQPFILYARVFPTVTCRKCPLWKKPISCYYWHTNDSKSPTPHTPTHCVSTMYGPLIVILTPVLVVGNDSQSKAWFSGSSERDHEDTRYLATAVTVSCSRCSFREEGSPVWTKWVLRYLKLCYSCISRKLWGTKRCWTHIVFVHLRQKEKQLVVSFKV